MESHSASTSLDDIIDELKLNYDSSVGLLDGENITNIPSLNILLNISKLFGNLDKQLKLRESSDDQILKTIKAIRGSKDISDEEYDAKGLFFKREEEDDGEGSVNVQRKRKNEDHGRGGAKRSKTDLLSHDSFDKQGDVTAESNNKVIPPIQTGSFTQSNDTRLKNPKSEFVASQTLSAEAITSLGLFSEDNNGLETHGKDYLKRKFGVASYPERDLKDLLPGRIPDVDFSKTKPPPNQVQFTTFQTYVESFFRPFANEDLKFLKENYVLPPGFEKSGYDPNLRPYLIPKLGIFYANLWAQEDPNLGAKLNLSLYHQLSPDYYKPKGSIDELDDDKLYTEDVSCGPLSSRLLSAILSSHEGGENDDDSYLDDNIHGDEQVVTKLDSGDDYKNTSETNDFYTIEERLKRELKYIGIFMNLHEHDDESKDSKFSNRLIKREGDSIVDNDDWIMNKEDDEISAELRFLQKELRGAVHRNRANKKKLIGLVEEQLAYQEYSTILEDLDKQVDQAYLKRLKAKNKKKKTELTPLQQQSANSGLRALLDKRKRWIDNIGKLFRSPEIMKRVPSTSVLKSGNDEEDDGEDEEIEDTAEQLIQK